MNINIDSYKFRNTENQVEYELKMYDWVTIKTQNSTIYALFEGFRTYGEEECIFVTSLSFPHDVYIKVSEIDDIRVDCKLEEEATNE